MCRCEDGKMKDEKMICIDVKMGKCEDVKMTRWICVDVKMGRCEDDIQTSTIRKTLRLDVLGN